MQIVRTFLVFVIAAIVNHALCGPGDMLPLEFAARSEDTNKNEITVQKIDCSSSDAIVCGLKRAMGLTPPPVEALPALPSMQSVALPVASVQTTSSCDSPFACCYPFAPMIMLNWGADVANIMYVFEKDNPKASGTVFDLYAIICRIGIQPFLNAYPQAQPVGLQLYYQAQQNPAVQEMNAQIKRLVHEHAPLKTRVAALMTQTAINTAVRQEIVRQSIPTFSPGESIPETIQLNDGKRFDHDGVALLAGNIYASIGDMSDQQKADPHAYHAYQQILQTVLPL